MEPKIVTVAEEMTCVGLMAQTSDATLSRDLGALYKRYQALDRAGELPPRETPWRYVSMSANFSNLGPKASWDYYTGHVVDGGPTASAVFSSDSGLVRFVVPAGLYAVFPLRCRGKFLFGLKMGLLKRDVYARWLPASEYEFDGLDFEFNDEAMWKVSPYDIDLYVRIRRK